MRPVVFLFLLAGMPLAGRACEPAPDQLPFATRALNAHFEHDGALVVLDRTHRVRIADVSERLDQVPAPPCVYAVQKRDGEYFAVVTVSHWTRGYPPSDGAGGSGEETSARWLYLAGDKLVASQDALYLSWRDNREGSTAWQGRVFTVTTEDLLEERNRSRDPDIWQPIAWTFDARHPEKGLSEARGKPHP